MSVFEYEQYKVGAPMMGRPKQISRPAIETCEGGAGVRKLTNFGQLAVSARRLLFGVWTGRTVAVVALFFGGIWLAGGVHRSVDAGHSGPPVEDIVMASSTSSSSLPVAQGSGQSDNNSDWSPVSRMFNGVEMVLVPAGCFVMGSDKGSSDESPAHQQCFDRPFWIDRTEVTNEQHGSHGYWLGPNRPRENISWFMAQEFCQNRGGRLPTEAEWEYAARGPNNLEYPWGNVFDGNKVVWYTFETAAVASKPGGASWVGAMDMSGGVWEWVSSIYKPYPYDSADGREADGVTDPVSERVLRGGSWEITISGNLRAANRFSSYPDDWSYGLVGFRCVRPY